MASILDRFPRSVNPDPRVGQLLAAARQFHLEAESLFKGRPSREFNEAMTNFEQAVLWLVKDIEKRPFDPEGPFDHGVRADRA